MSSASIEYITGTHYPGCNDKCEGDSHYLIGELEPNEDDATTAPDEPVEENL